MGRFSGSKKFDFLYAYGKVEDLWQEIPAVKKRKRKEKLRRFFKFLKYFIITALVILLLVAGAALMSLKKHYDHAVQGKNQLESAVEEARQGDFSEAEELASRAENNFKALSAGLERAGSGRIISSFPSLKARISGYNHLVDSAALLSVSLRRGSSLGVEAREIIGDAEISNFDQLDKEKKEGLLRLLYESLPEIKGIEADLDLALWNLERVDSKLILPIFSERLERAKEEILDKREDWNRGVKIASLLPKLAGYPGDSDFLVFFQNNDELRPTGGFLGTYGILTTKNGEIERFDTHNIYHMDMPLEGRLGVEPPAPIKRYLNNEWYMRDGNWSPDWPASARKLDWFFHKEEELLPPENKINDFQGDFDGVFAITPEFVTELLAITGPVTIEGKEYHSENFQDLLQYQVERGYEETNTRAWHRKEVIGKILQELKIELFDLASDEWSRVASSFQESLKKKDALLYFHNERYQALARELDWTGHIKDSPADYLMVVDSNMRALKTDSVMERGINYSLESSPNGLFADLRINYSHHGEPSWKVSEYKSYTRVLVPEGSELVEMNRNNLGPSGPSEADVTSVQGKTSFGTFLTLPPGEVGSLNLKYKLPRQAEEYVREKGKYVLLLQKQPGAVLKESSIDIGVDNEIISYQPTGFYATLRGENSVLWESDIVADRKMEVEFEK